MLEAIITRKVRLYVSLLKRFVTHCIRWYAAYCVRFHPVARMQNEVKNNVSRVLIVDDDEKVRRLLKHYLGQHGFEVFGVPDGDSMRRHLKNNEVDLVILDLILPGDDGFALARELRSSSHPAILMLSALGTEVDRILGLEMGADDYLPKPFNPRELLARIRAILRRCDATGTKTKTVSEFGPFRLNLANHRFTNGDEEIQLSAQSFNILKVFVEHPEKVLDRDTLMRMARGHERPAFDRSIDVCITRLRKKIEPDPKNPRYIRTVRSAGYLFSPDGLNESDRT